MRAPGTWPTSLSIDCIWRLVCQAWAGGRAPEPVTWGRMAWPVWERRGDVGLESKAVLTDFPVLLQADLSTYRWRLKGTALRNILVMIVCKGRQLLFHLIDEDCFKNPANFVLRDLCSWTPPLLPLLAVIPLIIPSCQHLPSLLHWPLLSGLQTQCSSRVSLSMNHTWD